MNLIGKIIDGNHDKNRNILILSLTFSLIDWLHGWEKKKLHIQFLEYNKEIIKLFKENFLDNSSYKDLLSVISSFLLLKFGWIIPSVHEKTDQLKKHFHKT